MDGITQLVGTWFQDHIAPRLVRPESAVRGIRWVSYDRPAYGGSTPHPGRDVASTAADLAGAWSWLLTVVEQAMAGGLGGMVDDDLASVAPWGFDPGQGRTPSAELWLRSDDGHVSVLDAAETALGWLREHARQG